VLGPPLCVQARACGLVKQEAEELRRRLGQAERALDNGGSKGPQLHGVCVSRESSEPSRHV
jgi:hypothetical protein